MRVPEHEGLRRRKEEIAEGRAALAMEGRPNLSALGRTLQLPKYLWIYSVALQLQRVALVK